MEKCVLCGTDIPELNYAIRDYSGEETYTEWIIRHVKKLLSFGFYKYIPFYLPVCDGCVEELKSYRNKTHAWLR